MSLTWSSSSRDWLTFDRQAGWDCFGSDFNDEFVADVRRRLQVAAEHWLDRFGNAECLQRLPADFGSHWETVNRRIFNLGKDAHDPAVGRLHLLRNIENG